jgi:hypothetical protein
MECYLSQPHFGAKCENATHTPKNGKMESSGTPENSEDDLRGQISSPWRIFYINGKLLKRRCPNGLTLPIWTSATQVMGKRRAGSQTANLTPDH